MMSLSNNRNPNKAVRRGEISVKHETQGTQGVTEAGRAPLMHAHLLF